MSIVKFTSTNDTTAAYQQQMFRYITAPVKTEGCIGANACSPEKALPCMQIVKKLYHKIGGRDSPQQGNTGKSYGSIDFSLYKRPIYAYPPLRNMRYGVQEIPETDDTSLHHSSLPQAASGSVWMYIGCIFAQKLKRTKF